jgi:hypothetical protein
VTDEHRPGETPEEWVERQIASLINVRSIILEVAIAKPKPEVPDA